MVWGGSGRTSDCSKVEAPLNGRVCGRACLGSHDPALVLEAPIGLVKKESTKYAPGASLDSGVAAIKQRTTTQRATLPPELTGVKQCVAVISSSDSERESES